MVRDPGARTFFRRETGHIDQLRAWNCDPYPKRIISVPGDLVGSAKVGMLLVHKSSKLSNRRAAKLTGTGRAPPANRGIEQAGL